MLYSVVRPLAAIALKVFLKKITITHAGRIPKGKPVILASNHPTAFMEPCILACFLDRPLYFLVRGDIFVKSLYIKLLKALHMLPVYRLKDRGYAFVKANFETFDTCYDALHECKTIMILAEGNTKAEKRLRPLKKGTARLAFGALDKYPDMEDVYVVPVGVNFDYMDRFRAEVMVNFGEPLSARSWYAQYYANNGEGIDAFTSELSRRMKEEIVVIEHKEDEALIERLLLMSRSKRSSTFWPVTGRDESWLREEIALARQIGDLPGEVKQKLANQTALYFDTLNRSGISDKTVFDNKPPSMVQGFLFLLGAPLYVMGFLLNFLPARLAKLIADTQVKSVEFYNPVLVAVALFLYVIYYGAALATGIHYYGIWSILLVVLAAMSGYYAVRYKESLSAWRQRLRWSRMKPDEKAKIEAYRAGIQW